MRYLAVSSSCSKGSFLLRPWSFSGCHRQGRGLEMVTLGTAEPHPGDDLKTAVRKSPIIRGRRIEATREGGE